MLAIAATVAASFAFANQNRTEELALAKEFLERTPDRLEIDAGEVLHYRREIYTRYGPKARAIAAVSDLATENSVAESWMEVGPDGSVVRLYARLRDASGTIVQQTVRQSGEERTIDPRTGELLLEPTSPPPTDARALPAAAAIGKMLESGAFRVISLSDSSLTIERRATLQPLGQDNDPADFQVPYFADLNGKFGVDVITVNNHGIVVRSDRYVETDEGERVPILSNIVTIHEILPTMPEGLFE